jgi:hypothetical protein
MKILFTGEGLYRVAVLTLLILIFARLCQPLEVKGNVVVQTARRQPIIVEPASTLPVEIENEPIEVYQ